MGGVTEYVSERSHKPEGDVHGQLACESSDSKECVVYLWRSRMFVVGVDDLK